MDDRTFIEWDKDDVDALNMMKVDVLALGMLTCIRKCFDLIDDHKGERWELATVPQDDKGVYDMLCRGESLGVFQVESRAQMNMLPRLKPRTFYDLVIEVAIVRPGPIQGDMVHPYLRRRNKIEKESYPAPSPAHGDKDELRRVLHKTLGVPLFQEQAMRIAIEAAGFTSEEANGLRRAMATFRNVGTIGNFEEKLIGNMIRRGYDPQFAKNCFEQIKGFGSYGFPESHAASFAQLVYISSWLKHYHPDAFCCGLLNSQPMGFYAPAQIVGDARKNGVEVREIDVSFSFAQNTLEEASGKYCAVRLGFRQIDGFRWVDEDEESLKRIQASFSDAQLRIAGTPALPLPLAEEGWGGGLSTRLALQVERPPPAALRASTSPASAGLSHLNREHLGRFPCSPSFETPRKCAAPQDEVLFRGKIPDPLGEERRLPARLEP
jgi:error-prone DNA polymerase